MAHLLFPSAIICSCGKRLESDWSADDSGKRRRLPATGSALSLFLRHRCARLANNNRCSAPAKPHSADVVLLRCLFCRNSIDVNHYGNHARRCGGSASRVHHAVEHYRRYRKATNPSFECYRCLDSDRFVQLDAATLIEHFPASHADESMTSYELYLSCRECQCRVPLCDAIGHAALWHADRIRCVADLFVTDSGSVQVDDEFCSTIPDPSARKDGTSTSKPDSPSNPDGPMLSTEIKHADPHFGSFAFALEPAPIDKRLDSVVDQQEHVDFWHECELCGSSLRTVEQLQAHCRLHEPYRGFRCRECGSDFRFAKTLQLHLARGHERPTRKYKCPHCERKFESNRDCLTHVRSHTGERPFVCAQCPNKRLATRDGLLKHRATKHGIGDYRCDQCGRCFVSRGGLDDHLRVHTDERPFECDECDKAFRHKGVLKSHKRLHALPEFLCVPCGKRFARRGYLMDHYGTRVHRDTAAAVAAAAVD